VGTVHPPRTLNISRNRTLATVAACSSTTPRTAPVRGSLSPRTRGGPLSTEFGIWASSLASASIARPGAATGPALLTDVPQRRCGHPRTGSPTAPAPASTLKWTQPPTTLPRTCQPSCPDSLNRHVAAVRDAKLGAQSHESCAAHGLVQLLQSWQTAVSAALTIATRRRSWRPVT